VRVPRDLLPIVRAGVRASQAIPGSVALGGTVCALFAGHRVSRDIDFVLGDLRDRFEEVRERLFALAGWQEARVRVPVRILGALDGTEIGYRQLRRSTPLETLRLETEAGSLVVPTLPELLRVKSFLAYERNYTRDFVDFAELSCLLDVDDVVGALLALDDRFGSAQQPSILLEVMRTLLAADPHDRQTHGFATLRLLEPKLQTWDDVVRRCQEIGRRLAIRVLGPGTGHAP
jgi:hypothetical protein